MLVGFDATEESISDIKLHTHNESKKIVKVYWLTLG